MTEDQFKQYVEQTKALVEQMNSNLVRVEEAIQKVGVIQKGSIELSASAFDMSLLVIRAMAELHPDFRAVLIRFAQEPPGNPAAAENRKLLLQLLAAMQRASGERPTLRPV